MLIAPLVVLGKRGVRGVAMVLFTAAQYGRLLSTWFSKILFFFSWHISYSISTSTITEISRPVVGWLGGVGLDL